jgi:hypothetical protein
MYITESNPYTLLAKENLAPKKAIVNQKLFTIEQIRDQLSDRYKDLDKDGYLDINMNEELSDNFTYKELIASDNAKKYGLENRVPANRIDIIENARYTAANVLEVCRSKFGSFTPNSWYRGPEVEYAATYRDGFSKYIQKTYKRSSNSEPTADTLITFVHATMFLRDLIKNATNSKMDSYAILLHLWNNYYSSKQHPRGEAVDFEIKGSLGNKALWDWIKNSSGIQYDQLILEFHNPSTGAFSGWVHCSATEEIRTGRKNRRSAFTI